MPNTYSALTAIECAFELKRRLYIDQPIGAPAVWCQDFEIERQAHDLNESDECVDLDEALAKLERAARVRAFVHAASELAA